MTAIPAGWGFRDPPRIGSPERKARKVVARGVYRRADELESYARTLSRRPSVGEVMDQFQCCSRSASRYLKVIRMFVR